ncbi:MAG TPA: 4-coumarate--CoA ligase family protein [Vicinamibacteria bacterium]|nr:4-coumarate--CoA ligase family protein [Vicinamibacteria bacterium]
MVFRSPWPPATVPEAPITRYVFERARGLGDRTAMVDAPTGRRITYSALEAAVERAAAGLAARGYVPGDVFGIFSPNAIEYAIAFHGVARMGGVVTTVNPLFTADELATQLRDCAARCLFTIPAFMEKARAAAAQAGLREVVVFGEAEGAVPLAELLDTPAPVPSPALSLDDVVALPYSSGTTGLPKGVMLTHRNLVANVEQFRATFPFEAGDVVMAVLPFFHIYGLQVILNGGLRQGATLVLLPRFELEGFLRAIQEHRVTVAFVVPPILLALAKHPMVAAFDLGSLRVVLSGAAPLGGELARAAADRLQCQVVQGYGMTETSPVTHTNCGRDSVAKPGSVGALVALTEGRVVDPGTGRDLGPGEQGEICVRGPQVMRGYLGRPDATRAMIDPDGWLHTGDIGYADEDGDFYVVDRLKELIKYKGCPVAPAELEALLLTHPAVADAAVVPSPDEEAGEVPKAFVVARAAVTPEDLMACVAERVAPTKRVRRLELIDQIPKSASGKILRRVLVERERARSS